MRARDCALLLPSWHHTCSSLSSSAPRHKSVSWHPYQPLHLTVIFVVTIAQRDHVLPDVFANEFIAEQGARTGAHELRSPQSSVVEYLR